MCRSALASGLLIGLVPAVLLPAPTAAAQTTLPPALRDIAIDQKLNSQIDLGLQFADESGAVVPLRRYFQGKPVVLALVYYRCPMLCTLVLNGVLRAARVLSFDTGRDYEIVAVSIDPSETPDVAAEKRAGYVSRYRRASGSAGWHFLTGEESNIRALASQVGFRYRYDPEHKQYVHAAGIMVLTPEGRLSRYFYGLEYAPRDLRLALIEASDNRIGTPVDQLLLYCLHYDPKSGKYGLLVMNTLRLGGAATLLALALFWLAMSRRRRSEVHS